MNIKVGDIIVLHDWIIKILPSLENMTPHEVHYQILMYLPTQEKPPVYCNLLRLKDELTDARPLTDDEKILLL